jgi:hypothetical protein
MNLYKTWVYFFLHFQNKNQHLLKIRIKKKRVIDEKLWLFVYFDN